MAPTTQRRKKAHRVTLCIGIGGSGVNCLSEVKAKIDNQSRGDSFAFSSIRFLAVDRDESPSHNLLPHASGFASTRVGEIGFCRSEKTSLGLLAISRLLLEELDEASPWGHHSVPSRIGCPLIQDTATVDCVRETEGSPPIIHDRNPMFDEWLGMLCAYLLHEKLGRLLPEPETHALAGSPGRGKSNPVKWILSKISRIPSNTASQQKGTQIHLVEGTQHRVVPKVPRPHAMPIKRPSGSDKCFIRPHERPRPLNIVLRC